MAVPGCLICGYLTEDLSVLFQTEHWVAQLAVEQGYLGHTFITATEHTASLSDLPEDQWQDLHRTIRRFENGLREATGARVFNWVCLMNDGFKHPDPQTHVHWKVRPRYDHPVKIAGTEFSDPNFAHHYDKSRDHDHMAPPGSGLRADIEHHLKGHF